MVENTTFFLSLTPMFMEHNLPVRRVVNLRFGNDLSHTLFSVYFCNGASVVRWNTTVVEMVVVFERDQPMYLHFAELVSNGMFVRLKMRVLCVVSSLFVVTIFCVVFQLPIMSPPPPLPLNAQRYIQYTTAHRILPTFIKCLCRCFAAPFFFAFPRPYMQGGGFALCLHRLGRSLAGVRGGAGRRLRWKPGGPRITVRSCWTCGLDADARAGACPGR